MRRDIDEDKHGRMKRKDGKRCSKVEEDVKVLGKEEWEERLAKMNMVGRKGRMGNDGRKGGYRGGWTEKCERN